MPTYTFRDKNTGQVFEKWMKISEKQTYLDQNPNLESILVPTGLNFDEFSRKKPDEGFKDVLRNIHDKAIGGQYMHNRYL